MKTTPRAFVIILVLLAMQVVVPSAAAHPLGNFTINHYAGLRVRRDAIDLHYVLDMAEIPAFQEISSLDADRDGMAETDETVGYHSAKCEATLPELDLRINGKPVGLSLLRSAIEFPPGVGGLLTLRLTCVFSAPMSSLGELTRVEFKNDAYAERQGWSEIVVTGEGVWLLGDLATMSPSDLLRAYPDGLLTSPLDQREISFEFALSPAAAAQVVQPVDQDNALPSGGRKASIVEIDVVKRVGPPALLFSVLAVITFGGLYFRRRRNA